MKSEKTSRPKSASTKSASTKSASTKKPAVAKPATPTKASARSGAPGTVLWKETLDGRDPLRYRGYTLTATGPLGGAFLLGSKQRTVSIDAATGKKLCEMPATGAPFAIDGVGFLTARNKIIAHDLESGKQLYEVSLPKVSYVHGQPGVLIAVVDQFPKGAIFVAYRFPKGTKNAPEEAWRLASGSSSLKRFTDRTVIADVWTDGKGISALSLEDGKILWSVPHSVVGATLASCGAADDSLALIGRYDCGDYSLEAWQPDGKIAWTCPNAYDAIGLTRDFAIASEVGEDEHAPESKSKRLFIDRRTGKLVRTGKPSELGFTVVAGESFFEAGLTGVRCSSLEGETLWEYKPAKPAKDADWVMHVDADAGRVYARFGREIVCIAI